MTEDWIFSEIYIDMDESRYSEAVRSFLSYGDVVLIVEENENIRYSEAKSLQKISDTTKITISL